MFKLIQVDIRSPEKEKWKIFVPENPNAKLDQALVVAQDKLILAYLEDVKVTETKFKVEVESFGPLTSIKD